MSWSCPSRGQSGPWSVRSRPVDLDLQGRMTDAEMVLQLLLRFGQKAVAGMSPRHHEMGRQRRLGRAHAQTCR